MSSILTERDASGTGVHGLSQMFEHDLELNFEVDLGAKRNLADAGIGPGSTPPGYLDCLVFVLFPPVSFEQTGLDRCRLRRQGGRRGKSQPG